MAVAKQTYSAAANWTAVSFANLFKSAFIDAGFMTDWYDSFISGGIENRVLEVQYQSTKSYGKCYYWFMFTTSQVSVAITSGWNSAARVPTGTQWLDYVSTSTNTINNHHTVVSSLTTSTQLDLVRYTSGVNTSYSWFVLRNGATPNPFFIAPASSTVVPWLDLNKFLFHHFVRPSYVFSSTSDNAVASIRFGDVYRLRRSYRDAQTLRDVTLGDYYRLEGHNMPLHGYRSLPFNSYGTYIGIDERSPISVPYGFPSVNTAFTANYTPVIYGYSYSPYVTQSMPVDFGLQFSYLSTTFSFADRVVITSGSEEWEVIDFRNNNTTTSGSPLLLARVA